MAVARAIATVWLPLCYWYRSSGSEHVPPRGAVILAPNHTSFLDPVLVTYPIRQRRLYYLAWHQLFANPAFAWVIRALGAISLDTERKADRVAYEKALHLLREGEAICLFPEGVRGWDGRLYPLQSGVARLAMASGAPIIPVAVRGALEAWPRWRSLPRAFVPISVRYLEPIIPQPTTNAAERRAETQRLLTELDRVLRRSLESPASK
jgi:1-acyl-sn-glycerol-3-phosphate acyltransferase